MEAKQVAEARAGAGATATDDFFTRAKNVAAVAATHKGCGKLATVTAVRPPSRFGGLTFESGVVTDFVEKPQIGEGWINGGFLVFEPRVFD